MEQAKFLDALINPKTFDSQVDNGPSDLDIEYALLGAILSNNALMNELGFLHESDFHSIHHAVIFKEMRKKHLAGQPITPFSIVLSDEETKPFDRNDGLKAYLGRSLRTAFLITSAQEAGRMLSAMGAARSSVSLLKTASESILALSEGVGYRDILGKVKNDIDSIMRNDSGPQSETDYEITGRIIENLKYNKKPYSTGLLSLDMAMDGGLYPGKAYGFAARKKVGKTVLASTISCNLNAMGVKHAFICGEMSPEEVQQRNLSRLTDSYPSAFRTDYGRSPEFIAKLQRVAMTSKRCIHYYPAPGLTFSQLQTICSTAAYIQKVKVIILDYWQLVGGKRKGQSTAEHLDEVAQWIADFGRKTDIATITMAQINQEGNTRGGEGIRLAFDQVYEIHRDDITMPATWLEMMDTRYTAWMNIGSKDRPGLRMNDKGPYFTE